MKVFKYVVVGEVELLTSTAALAVEVKFLSDDDDANFPFAEAAGTTPPVTPLQGVYQCDYDVG